MKLRRRPDGRDLDRLLRSYSGESARNVPDRESRPRQGPVFQSILARAPQDRGWPADNPDTGAWIARVRSTDVV